MPENNWIVVVTHCVDTLKSLFTSLLHCLTILLVVCFVGIVIMNGCNNKAFELQESRLAEQISAIRKANVSSLTKDQKESLIRLLIEKYDPSTDSLNPILNPNAKPLDLEKILMHYKLDNVITEVNKVLEVNNKEEKEADGESGAKIGW